MGLVANGSMKGDIANIFFGSLRNISPAETWYFRTVVVKVFVRIKSSDLSIVLMPLPPIMIYKFALKLIPFAKGCRLLNG